MNFICFDLEGPLSPEDNAYNIMRLFHNGGRIFEILSHYDDLLSIDKTVGWRKKYEAGDTLALIIPFLVYHGISTDDIKKVAKRATLVDGARELIAQLKARGWWVGDLTTSYEHYGYTITERIGIPWPNVACTRVPIALDYCHSILSDADRSKVENVQRDLMSLRPGKNDAEIRKRLDFFFGVELRGTVLGQAVEMVRPLGGKRKVDMLRQFAKRAELSLAQVIVVGDSITDAKMLRAVHRAGGLAIAFNANEYALPYATMGLASTNLGDLRVALYAWEEGGRQAVEKVVKEIERAGSKGERNHFHWLSGRKNLEQPLSIHKRIRGMVRRQAAKLG